MTSIATGHRALGRAFGLAFTTALTGALLAGCATNAAPPASQSASRAQEALEAGKLNKAIAHAEAAVLAEPHDPAYRATLAAAYLDAGRFASAATSFDDALQLGEANPRLALGRALALTGQGDYAAAAALLDQWEGRIPVADHGLALALAGDPERGIRLMAHAIRSGETSAKLRQNLAYAYALAGRWREARLMAGQDLQGETLNDRIEQWSRLTRADAWQQRVAALLQVPAGVADAGQPAQLALANNPSVEQLGEEAQALAGRDTANEVALAASLPPAAELPALAAAEPQPAAEPVVEPDAQPRTVRDFHSAFAAATAQSVAQPAGPVTREALTFASAPVVQPVAPARQPAVAAVAKRVEGSHLVQLGSFSSEQGARRAWGVYLKKYPQLSGHEMVISQAVVRGKNYWRVSAAGFGRSSASTMCGQVRSSGEGCFAYAAARPLPGAIDSGIRMARR